MVPQPMNGRRLLLWAPFLLFLGNFVSAAAQSRGTSRAVVDSTSKPSTPEQPGGYYALVIGIDSYKSLTPLRTPRNDAKDIAEVLQDHYGFVTKLLLDATRDQILGALDDYRGSLQQEDSLLIYYAGHGHDDKEAHEAYWIPVDGQQDTTARWINAAEITGKARAMAARHVLIISDSCYSGMLTEQRDVRSTIGNPRDRDRALEKALQGKSRHIMSSGGDEPVSDVNAPGHSSNHSVFADALLQGFKEIPSNEFTANELFNQYIHDQVGGESNQMPEYQAIRDSGHNSGDFVFFRLSGPAATQPAVAGSAVVQPNTRAPVTAEPAAEAGPAAPSESLLTRAKAVVLRAGGDPQGEAYSLFKQAAEGGSAEAMRYMGCYYDSHHLNYRGVVKSDAAAVSWYSKAADAGDALGMEDLAVMYRHGRGVPQDEGRASALHFKALDRFQSAAEAGDSKAMVFVCQWYVRGKLVAREQTLATKANWCRKAAEAGEAEAMLLLAEDYKFGKGVPKDEAQAEIWGGRAVDGFRSAAEAGDSPAMMQLCQMYSAGKGVAKDMTQAANWCRKAAEAGDTKAMYFIAEQYKLGVEVPKDEAQAVNWYRKMAEAGDAVGMHCLGEMYENGTGVSKDQAQALDWYRKAAAAGDSSAQDRLKELGER